MADFLAQISTFFSQALTWMGSLLDTVMAEPALVVMVLAIPICGVVFGYVRRLISL